MNDGDRTRESGTRTYTVRLELVDEPGELLRVLEPIAEAGGNLLSIFHERGNLTPRGHIPVEIDLECPPDRFEAVVAGLREEGVNVVRAGAETYTERVSVVLSGHLVETDLSDTLERLEACPGASVVDLALNAPEGREEVSSARIGLAVEADATDRAVETVREVAREKDLTAIEPLVSEGSR